MWEGGRMKYYLFLLLTVSTGLFAGSVAGPVDPFADLDPFSVVSRVGSQGARYRAPVPTAAATQPAAPMVFARAAAVVSDSARIPSVVQHVPVVGAQRAVPLVERPWWLAAPQPRVSGVAPRLELQPHVAALRGTYSSETIAALDLLELPKAGSRGAAIAESLSAGAAATAAYAPVATQDLSLAAAIAASQITAAAEVARLRELEETDVSAAIAASLASATKYDGQAAVHAAKVEAGTEAQRRAYERAQAALRRMRGEEAPLAIGTATGAGSALPAATGEAGFTHRMPTSIFRIAGLSQAETMGHALHCGYYALFHALALLNSMIPAAADREPNLTLKARVKMNELLKVWEPLTVAARVRKPRVRGSNTDLDNDEVGDLVHAIVDGRGGLTSPALIRLVRNHLCVSDEVLSVDALLRRTVAGAGSGSAGGYDPLNTRAMIRFKNNASDDYIVFIYNNGAAHERTTAVQANPLASSLGVIHGTGHWVCCRISKRVGTKIASHAQMPDSGALPVEFVNSLSGDPIKPLIDAWCALITNPALPAGDDELKIVECLERACSALDSLVPRQNFNGTRVLLARQKEYWENDKGSLALQEARFATILYPEIHDAPIDGALLATSAGATLRHLIQVAREWRGLIEAGKINPKQQEIFYKSFIILHSLSRAFAAYKPIERCVDYKRRPDVLAFQERFHEMSQLLIDRLADLPVVAASGATAPAGSSAVARERSTDPVIAARAATPDSALVARSARAREEVVARAGAAPDEAVSAEREAAIEAAVNLLKRREKVASIGVGYGKVDGGKAAVRQDFIASAGAAAEIHRAALARVLNAEAGR